MAKAVAPKGLSREAADLFEETVSNFGIEDSTHRQHLLRAAEALDRIRAAQAELKRSGLVTRDRHGVLRAHPCVAIERGAVAAYISAFRLLKLEPPEV